MRPDRTNDGPQISDVLDPHRDAAIAPPTRTEKTRAVVLFIATLFCVYWVYGRDWMGGDPFTDPEIAVGSAKFAVALMSILLAHEMGHYIVARRHGFALSLPYFIPFPAAMGTFGAIIRLQSAPKTRSALLEMGAAGPIAGFLVALIVLALGLPATELQTIDDVRQALAEAQASFPPVSAEEPGALGQLLLLFLQGVEVVLRSPPFSWFLDLPEAGALPITILHNPPIMDLVGQLVLGRVPGRYDTLDPLAMAGWVGCLLTAINLVPIGQLDGGHILNALSPRWAPRIARPLMGIAFVAGVVFWPGWAVWAFVLLALRAWMSLPVPIQPPLSPRARLVAALAGIAFLLSFMPQPVELESITVPAMLPDDVPSASLPLVPPAEAGP